MFKFGLEEKKNIQKIFIKSLLFILISYIAIFYNSKFSTTTIDGTVVSIYYIFGGVILSLVLLFGTRYGWLTLISILLFIFLQGQSIGFTEYSIFIILTIIYTSEAFTLNKLGFNLKLKRPIDLVYLLGVTFVIHSSIVVIIILLNLLEVSSFINLYRSLLQYWFRDIIGILTIYPIIKLLFDHSSTFIKAMNLNLTSLGSIKKYIENFLNKIRKNFIDFMVLLTIPILNEIVVYVNSTIELEIFYLIYVPGIWLASKYGGEHTFLLVPTINMGLIINRNQISLNILEIQMLIFIFTLLIYFLSIVIGERNQLIAERNEIIEERNKIITGKNRKLSQSNRQLNQLNKQLRTSNRELEQFAYVASHDLQEPLRAINGYLNLYDKKYGNYPDDKSENYIKSIILSAEQMQVMINDLLSFSRIGTRNLELTKVDLNEVLSEALKLLSTNIDASNAELDYDNLPKVKGNKVQLRLLFQNLISNAIKYSDTEPQISISSSHQNGYTTISVNDNGIGISPEYFDKIFIIFQRLHGKHEYSGSGIGLAICKKIVEQHDGEIWVESDERNGSTFKFTLPIDKGGHDE